MSHRNGSNGTRGQHRSNGRSETRAGGNAGGDGDASDLPPLAPEHPRTLVVLGLSITSSWGNGHATTFRALIRALAARGCRVLFLERDVPWYAENRDLPRPPYCRTELYRDLADLERFAPEVEAADAVIVGSYVPEGVAVAEWALSRASGPVAFYDIDTPVTLARLAAGDREYLSPELVPRFALYLSFAGGPVLGELEERWGARAADPLYCSVDPAHYFPEDRPARWDLGYMGTYSDDRQPILERLLLEPARRRQGDRFVVAGPLFPPEVCWPANVERIEHLPPAEHRGFYCSQRFTLNVTRADMVASGWSPSVRLFEAAACGTPVISDRWPGLERFFVPGEEIFLAATAEESLAILADTDEDVRRRVAAAARRRVLGEHTSHHRAGELLDRLAAVGASPLPALAFPELRAERAEAETVAR